MTKEEFSKLEYGDFITFEGNIHTIEDKNDTVGNIRNFKTKNTYTKNPVNYAKISHCTEEELKSIKMDKTSLGSFSDEIEVITIGVHGKDKVQVTRSTGTTEVIIHYPEVLLTSSSSTKRTQVLKDCFIKISFVNATKRMGTVYFRRSTFSYPEIKARYAHSHVSNGVNSWSSSVCQGNTSLKKASSLLSMSYDKQSYEDFLYLLNSWMQWESLDGGPHIQLSNVKDIYSDNSSIGILNAIDLQKNLTNFLKEFDIKVNLDENSDLIQMKLDEDYLIPIINSVSTNKLYYDKEINKYLNPGFNLESIKREIKELYNSYAGSITFNSKVYPLVIEEPVYKLDKDAMVAHPMIKNHIINTVKEIINAKYNKSEAVSLS